MKTAIQWHTHLWSEEQQVIAEPEISRLPSNASGFSCISNTSHCLLVQHQEDSQALLPENSTTFREYCVTQKRGLEYGRYENLDDAASADTDCF
ncbi:hypothetical protein BHE74_00029043 [Ensete ventricosum]|nr:hypothetical protein BHE74_00029043 [Ensete ventricosum]